jgi:Na+/proline symporter
MLPKWLTGLLMISLLSATLSTAGAITLGAAQQMTTNIIKDALFPKMSDKVQLNLMRIMCIVYLGVCLAMALNLPVIMPVFFFCFMLNIPLFFCYITGMFITNNKVTCYLTLIGGYIVAFWWTFAPPQNMPYPFGDTTWAVVAISFILGLVLPLILKNQGKPSLNKVIKESRAKS